MTSVLSNRTQLVEDFAAKRLSVSSYPAIMYIEATRGCPYRCAMCNVPDMFGRKSQDVEDALLAKVEPYFKYLRILGIHCAGEPLLSQKLDYFIDQAAQHDFYLHANTTGFYLKPKLADRLLDAKLHLIFSIHAGSSQSYRNIMGADFERVIENIAYLSRRSQEVGRPENELWFSYIVVQENVDEIDDFLELAARIGIRKVRFMALHANKKVMTGTPRKGEDFSYKYLEQFNASLKRTFLNRLPRIRDRARELGVSIETGSMEHAARHKTNTGELLRKAQKKLLRRANLFPILPRKGSCMAPWIGQVQVKQDGEVNLCCSTDYPLGNLNTQSFDALWNGPRMQDIRRKFSGDVIPRACGGCRGVHLDEYGIPLP